MGLIVNPVTNSIDLDPTYRGNPTEALINALALQKDLDAIIARANTVDDQLAHAIDMADGDDPIPLIPGPPADAGARLQNEIDAFRQVFGREPETAADWDTAAMLDPHSYDPKNQGVPANVVVGRIRPVPGQGQVRGNMFIPAEAVLAPAPTSPPFDRNAGDNRRFDSAALPENSRVSFLVDYENGLVIARQNPSINLDNGAVQAGIPNVNVAQLDDGSVFLGYAAADPFSPGGEGIAKETIAVKGSLAIAPGAAGPTVGGTVTAFPALEVYNERLVAGTPTTSTLAQMYPSIDDQWGPLAGLWRSVGVGDRSLMNRFVAPSGPLPLLLPTTELGSAANPPTVVTVPR